MREKAARVHKTKRKIDRQKTPGAQVSSTTSFLPTKYDQQEGRQ